MTLTSITDKELVKENTSIPPKNLATTSNVQLVLVTCRQRDFSVNRRQMIIFMFSFPLVILLIGFLYFVIRIVVWGNGRRKRKLDSEERIGLWIGVWAVFFVMVVSSEASIEIKIYFTIIDTALVPVMGFFIYFLTRPKKTKLPFMQKPLLETKTSPSDRHSPNIRRKVALWSTSVLYIANIAIYWYRAVHDWQTTKLMDGENTVYVLTYDNGWSIIYVLVGVFFLMYLIWTLRQLSRLRK